MAPKTSVMGVRQCLAARRGDMHAVAAWLDGGGGMDARCAEHENMTLLMAAAVGGQEAMVRMLMQRGASVNLQDPFGVTALMLAAMGYTTGVQALLDAQADASLQNVHGETALLMAERDKRTATAKLLRQHIKRQTAEEEARAATSMAHGAAAAGAMATELMAEEAAEKEKVVKQGKGKEQKTKPTPKAMATRGSSAESAPAVSELPSEDAGGPQEEARAATAAQKARAAAADAAVEQAQAEAIAADRAPPAGDFFTQ